MRFLLVTLLALALSLSGCTLLGDDEPPSDAFSKCQRYALSLTERTVENVSDGMVTYRVTLDGGADGAGQVASLIAGHNGTVIQGEKITLDPAGKITTRITVPADWDFAVITATINGGAKCGYGSTDYHPQADAAAFAPAEPTTEPDSDASCVSFIDAIDTDREHYTGESDAIFRVRVAGGVEDGSKVRGTVSGVPVEGEVVNGVAELRHRVYEYGDYTLVDIQIDAPDCPHDRDQDRVQSATASVR